jgi:hypothetical protein
VVKLPFAFQPRITRITRMFITAPPDLYPRHPRHPWLSSLLHSTADYTDCTDTCRSSLLREVVIRVIRVIRGYTPLAFNRGLHGLHGYQLITAPQSPYPRYPRHPWFNSPCIQPRITRITRIPDVHHCTGISLSALSASSVVKLPFAFNRGLHGLHGYQVITAPQCLYPRYPRHPWFRCWS